MYFFQHHVSCESHLHLHVFFVCLITSLSLLQEADTFLGESERCCTPPPLASIPTDLFSGKQFAFAFHMAHEEDSSNSSLQRVLQQGCQVNFRPRTPPLHVKIEIVKHSNRHHDGVAEVQQASANSLSAKQMNSKTCAQKGDYPYYGMQATFS